MLWDVYLKDGYYVGKVFAFTEREAVAAARRCLPDIGHRPRAEFTVSLREVMLPRGDA